MMRCYFPYLTNIVDEIYFKSTRNWVLQIKFGSNQIDSYISLNPNLLLQRLFLSIRRQVVLSNTCWWYLTATDGYFLATWRVALYILEMISWMITVARYKLNLIALILHWYVSSDINCCCNFVNIEAVCCCCCFFFVNNLRWLVNIELLLII